MMQATRCLIFLGLLLTACADRESASLFDAAAVEAAAQIDAALIREVVAEIADDRYGGRAPGSEGDRMTRRYLAERLGALGFEPGAAGGRWDQPFELIGINAAQPGEWLFDTAAEPVRLTQGEDFIAASGVQAERAALQDSELVFVGYGIQAPEFDWDDYKGAELGGKTLLMLNNDPDWDPELFNGVERLYYGRWTYKYESAARQGAAGAIILHTDASAGYPWQVVQSSWSGEQFEIPATGDDARIQVSAWTTEAATRRLVAAAGYDLDELVESAKSRDFAPVALGMRTSLVLQNRLTRNETANVIGVLHGSDPGLDDEFVIYTAHHDHLGVAENGAGEDAIYNGARDNATGVGMILSIGKAFAALPTPPRRSIMLLFVGAEEQGLLGSEYFARYPTVAPGRIAANVNFDSGNIWGRTRDITFIGFGKSDLDDVAERVAEYQGRIVKPDQAPSQGLYYRSDQFNFASIGVPAFYFDSGTDFIGREAGWGERQAEAYNEQHYHQPSDELNAAWNFDGMVEDAEFGFWAGLAVANAGDLPQWRPGSEFEAVRAAALEEAAGLELR